MARRRHRFVQRAEPAVDDNEAGKACGACDLETSGAQPAAMRGMDRHRGHAGRSGRLDHGANGLERRPAPDEHAERPPVFVSTGDRGSHVSRGDAGGRFDTGGAQEAHQVQRGGARVPARHLKRGLRRVRLEPSIAERPDHHARIFVLPNIPGIATTNEQKLALTRVWLRGWNKTGFWLSKMPLVWWQNEVRSHSGKFSSMKRVLDAKGAKASFGPLRSLEASVMAEAVNSCDSRNP